MRMKKEVASVAAVNVLTKGAGLGFLRSKASSSSSGRAGGGGTPIEILSPITPAYRERESGDGCFIHETCVAAPACLRFSESKCCTNSACRLTRAKGNEIAISRPQLRGHFAKSLHCIRQNLITIIELCNARVR